MADVDNAGLIAEYYSLVISNYTGYATLALIVYEYLITVGAEVELFWRRKITGASILFLTNRYLVLFYNLSLLRDLWPFTLSLHRQSCGQWANGTRAVEILCYVPWGALRVFALTNRNWFVALIVFLLSMAPVAVNFADFRWSTISIDPVWGCGQDVAESPALSTSRTSLIASDLVVIVVTWLATYKTTRLARVAGHKSRMTLSVLLLRDGMIYFIVLLAMNVMHLAFSTSSVLINVGNGNVSDIIQVIEPINAILVWRFMLNLQETRWRTEEDLTTIVGSQQHTSTLFFDRVIGSIGDSLQLGSSGAVETGEGELTEDS
ncbi:hypothetical protein GSI_07535 [Ganoderma sinense ZZ0214-1]|uniref:DUF6533 domain-containing protein n=1 Tax=Ganoderma sinense ZZ0214-1 TaxID=1077348 RepID=A0A2G8S9B4_9APHY|nr:hypothetical protein GSI_07535 [Ganoderma sinense ZZ0214-1]